eukprot:RCo039437
MAQPPNIRGLLDDPRLRYIQNERLYEHVDNLVSRFLATQPSSAEFYFEHFFKFLESHSTAAAEEFAKPRSVQGPAVSTPLKPVSSSVALSSECSPQNSPLSSDGLKAYFSIRTEVTPLDQSFTLLYEIPTDACNECSREQDPKAGGFLDFKIKVGHREFDLRGVGAPPKCFPVPCELRLGHLFLWELGIDLNLPDLIPGNTDKVAPLPCVRFRSQLDAKRTSQVVISAKQLDSYLKHRFGSGKLEKWKSAMDVDDLAEVYGKKVFRVEMKELKRLARYTQVFTAVLPKKFFLKMVSIVSRDELVKWYYEHKEVALSEMGEGVDLSELGQLIRDLTEKPELRVKYGFPLKTYWTNVSRQSLSELSTQVCVACMGYLFTGYNNQIAPRT